MTDYQDKFCYECKHFSYIPWEPGYSEYTPGQDAYMICHKEDVNFLESFNKKKFGEALRHARTCEHFELDQRIQEQLHDRTS